ncbi:MAG TPA: type II CAAX endopeptidase family protein [Roseiflexaceae bacterium]|nr:type II CAAX endopeptidase family protein [Roseiflexaceae bacterium]
MTTTVPNKRPMGALVRVFYNAEQRRARALWRICALMGLFLVGILVFGLVFGLVAFGLAGGRVGPTATPFLVAGSAAALLSALLSVWLTGRFLDRRPVAGFGFHLGRDWWLDLGFGLALGALLMTGIFLVERAAGWVEVETSWWVDAGESFALAILAPLFIFVCVGIYEELLMRGYLLRNLAEGFNSRMIGPRVALMLAWVLSSAIFGLAHAGNANATVVSTLNIALAGIFLGLGYVLTGELAVPIGLHITWNFFQGNVYGFPVSGNATRQATVIAIEQRGPQLWTGGAFGPEAGLIGIAALLVGSLLIVVWVRMRYGTARLCTSLAIYEKGTST